MTRHVLIGLWLMLGCVPLLWWLLTRRQPDLWRAMPVPTAVLDQRGQVLRRSGPAHELDLSLDTGLPAPGTSARATSADGTRVAVSGLTRGALVMALPEDPVRDRRDQVLAELGARLAHDINTPLGVLYGHLDLIAHENVPDTVNASVATCQRELMRLQRTAQDLLALTRLRSGQSRRSIHLAGALAEEAAAGLLEHAERLDARLDVEVPHERVSVEVAEGDLVRALRNLLHNALEHGLGEQRAVGLRVAPDRGGTGVTFTVWDSGMGLAGPEELARLCEPLIRGRSTPSTGSGLGLAIVNEVLVGHGSQLRTARNKGRHELSFTLPRVR